MAIFYIARRAPKLHYYGDVIYTLLEISRRIRWWCLKCVIVYLARDIPPFVMYCVNDILWAVQETTQDTTENYLLVVSTNSSKYFDSSATIIII